MSDDHPLLRFNIPAGFVLERAMPTGAELAYGFHAGWISRADVVTVASARYEANVPMSTSEEAIALLLSDELDQVDSLIGDLEIVDEPVERRARFWWFLALAWLLEHRAGVDDPLGVIEMVYADSDYPEEMSGLVRFMPPVPGQPSGSIALEERWRGFVDRVEAEYRDRDLSS